MTLDDIRRLAAEERAVAEKATPGPWEFDPIMDGEIEGPAGGAVAFVAHHASIRTVLATGEEFSAADARYIARSRSAVPALCDAVDALLAVVDALPKCASHCGQTATALTEAGTFRCDAHKHAYTWHSLPYADALRAIARKP